MIVVTGGAPGLVPRICVPVTMISFGTSAGALLEFIGSAGSCAIDTGGLLPEYVPAVGVRALIGVGCAGRGPV